MPLPPRYSIYPTAVLFLDMPAKLKSTYIILYALAWNRDYRYVTESLQELAEIFDGIEPKRVTFNSMRRRIKTLEAYGLIKRERVGLRYRTILLLRHDQPMPEIRRFTPEETLERDLTRGDTGRVSTVDKLAYSVLDALRCEYERQYSPDGCPFWFDIYIPQSRLLIELDCPYWHDKGEAAEKDSRKDAWAEVHGYRIVHLEVDDLRDESSRIRLRKQLEQLVQGEDQPAPSQRGGNYVAPLPPETATSIISNIAVVADASCAEDSEDQQQQQLFNKPTDVEQNEELLQAMGVVGGPVYRLARETWVTPDYLEAIMAYRAAEAARGNKLGAGWVVKYVGEGCPAPGTDQGPEPDRYRYIRGKYRDYIKH